MRNDTSSFRALTADPVKSLRRVIEIEFSPSHILTLTSHDDVTWSTGTLYKGLISGVSTTSQRLNPESANSTIGTFAFDAIDYGGTLTTALRNHQLAGREITDKKVRYYLGGGGFTQSEYVLICTQIVQSADFNDGVYAFRCSDIQHQERRYIFDPQSTTLSATIAADATTITVGNTTGFEMVAHNAAWSDAPSTSVGYLKIGDEIIRYTGISGNQFTGCTRGALNTVAQEHKVGTESEDRRKKVEEYIYLELPSLKLMYAVLTGIVYGEGHNLPDHWHLGIDPSFVRLTDLTGAGPDLWNTTSDSLGIPLRFEGLKRIDGKQFIEREILLLLNAFSPIYADGTIGFRRRTNIGEGASYVRVLDDDNLLDVGTLNHDSSLLANSFTINWNYNGDRYTRATKVLDSSSIALYGLQRDVSLNFRGLHGARHTRGVVLSLIDNLRDSFADIPVRIDVKCPFNQNDLEVGDLVRLRASNVRDYQGTATTIDRTFEIQQVVRDDETGRISLKLFGSSKKPGPGIDQSIGVTPQLPDAWWSSEGTNLTSVPGLSFSGSNPTIVTGSATLNGGADATDPSAIYYFTGGDLEIASGCTLTVSSGTVQIRVKGFLDVKGTITAAQKGHNGAAAGDGPLEGTAGYLGTTVGHDWVDVGQTKEKGVWARLTSVPGIQTVGRYGTLPAPIGLRYDPESASLLGLPIDLRGSSGGRPGGKLAGSGGKSGGGLIIVCRGMDFSNPVQGTINLSGGDGGSPGQYIEKIWDPNPGEFRKINLYGGAGAPGAPGGILVVLDGGASVIPGFANHLVANYGNTPELGTQLPSNPYEPGKTDVKDSVFAGQYNAVQNQSRWADHSRVVFVPAVETPEEDVNTDPTLLYYIKPLYGTSLDATQTTLTIQARKVTSGGDFLVQDGTIQLYLPNDTLAGNGYTAVLDATDITDSLTVTLKDGALGEPVDTITLIDLTDESNNVIGSVEATNGLAYSQAPNSGPWSPNTSHTDLVATFYRNGSSIATRTVRVTLNQSNGHLTASDQGGTGESTSFALTGQTTNALTVSFTHVGSGVQAIETVVSVAGGTDGANGNDAELYYIKPVTGTAIKNGSGTLTVEARKVTGGQDVLLNTGTIQLYVGSTLVSVGNGYATGSNGYTGVFDAGDINNSAVVTLKDGAGGTALDTITLVDVQDGGDGVYGFIEPSNGLTYVRAEDGGAWNTTALTRLDCTFVKGGVEVARIARQVTLDQATGNLTIGAATHGGGDLNTGTVAVNALGSGTRRVSLQFEYTSGSDNAIVAEDVAAVVGGSQGNPGENATFPYIRVVNGTQIKNGVGQLTLEARQVDGQSDTLLSSGTVQLYAGSTLITAANGYVTGSNGYTGIFDAGDISGDLVVTLKDGPAGTVLDSVTLVDVTDGDPGAPGSPGTNAPFGYIEPSAPLSWVRAVDQTTWSPTATTVDLDATFMQGSTVLARRAWRITRDANGLLTGATTAHKDGDLNTGTVTVTEIAENSQSMSVKFTYSSGGLTTSVTETVSTALSGSNGSNGTNGLLYYIKPTAGTAIMNGVGQLTLEARKIDGTADTLLSTGSIQLYVGSTLVTAANGYVTGSNGYTGIFDAGDITGDVVVSMKDGPAGTTYDTITLVDVTDGANGAPGSDGANAVYGYVTPSGPVGWVRAVDQSTWTPTGTTVDLDFTFVQGGADVARYRWRITRTAAGILTGAAGTHPSGNLNTGRLTVSELNESTQSMSVRMTYSYLGDTAAVTETVTAVLSGTNGTNGTNAVNGVLTNESVTVAAASNGTGYSLTNAGGTFKVWSGTSDVTTSSTFNITGGVDSGASWSKTQNGLSFIINETTGVYSLSGGSWTSSAETFTVTATYSGVTITRVYSIAKALAGANGSDSTTYEVECSNDFVSKNAAGTYLPTSVTFSSYSTTGTAARAAYAGRFIIATSTDGTNFTNQYTSAGNESSKVYAVPSNIVAIRARLYLAGGTTTLVDQQTVAVVVDGQAGATGSRGPGRFEVGSGASGTGYAIDAADVTAWNGGAISAGQAAEGAAYVIATSSNGYIEPGDHLTMYNPGVESATRIYTGSRTNAYGGVVAADWSSKIAEVIDGSLLVNGTIQSSALFADNLGAIKATLGDVSAGTVNLSTSGHIRSGMTAYNTGVGFWLGTDGGYPKLSIGDPANGKYLRYDGSTGILDVSNIQITNGFITNSLLGPSAARIVTSTSGHTGPFSPFDVVGYGNDTGNAKTITSAEFWAPNYDTGTAGFHRTRVAFRKVDVVVTCVISGDSGSVPFTVGIRYLNNNVWTGYTNFVNSSYSGANRSSYTFVARHTTNTLTYPNWQKFQLQFAATNNCRSMTMRVDVYNGEESGNTANTTGYNSTGTVMGTAPTPPSWTYDSTWATDPYLL